MITYPDDSHATCRQTPVNASTIRGIPLTQSPPALSAPTPSAPIPSATEVHAIATGAVRIGSWSSFAPLCSTSCSQTPACTRPMRESLHRHTYEPLLAQRLSQISLRDEALYITCPPLLAGNRSTCRAASSARSIPRLIPSRSRGSTPRSLGPPLGQRLADHSSRVRELSSTISEDPAAPDK